MAFVDNVIQYLRKAQGERIVLESDKECIVFRAGGGSVPTGQKLSFVQLKGMIEEIIPDEQRMAFASGHPVLFPYTGSGGSIDVEASQPDGVLRISLGAADVPVPSIPEPTAATAHAQPAQTGPSKKIGHIDELFRMLRDIEGSDLHLSSNDKPFVRVHGVMKKLEEYEVSDPVYLKKILWDIVPQRNKTEWEKDHDTDFAYEIPGVARFRCNIFADRHGVGASSA